MEIKVKKLHPDAIIPDRNYEGDACYDLYAVDDYEIIGNETKMIHFGIAWELPRGYCGIVFARSSSFAIKGLKVNTGIVDQQYRGEIVCLVNLTAPHSHEFASNSPKLEGGEWYETKRTHMNSYKVKKGESIAQVMFQKLPPVNLREVKELSKSKREEKGFGSTG